jgi:hypothetical protein
VPPTNGVIVRYPDTRVGTNVTFHCIDGYRPAATMNSTCNEFGIWIPLPEEHVCTLVEGILNASYKLGVHPPTHFGFEGWV